MGSQRLLVASAAVLIAMVAAPAVSAAPPSAEREPTRLVSGLQGGAGSTVGPDGALYVTETAAGRVSRVDPKTGAVTTYASGLPKSVVGLGGATDVAFIGRTAYVLVTLVGPDVGGSSTVGIYRVDGRDRFTVVADVGAWVLRNPPNAAFDVPTGLQFALQPYGKGFLVTDGHHNRVLRVLLDGRVRELRAFGNVVPTGLDVSGNRVYMAQAGPIPYDPEDGKVVSFKPRRGAVTEVASGVSFLVDVEFGRGRTLFALSQGVGGGDPAGAPAEPGTGSLVRMTRNGSFTVVAEGLDRPTSLEIIRDSAYVITLGGEVWRYDVTRKSRGSARRRP